MRQTLTVVCPVYNEEAGIAEFHRELKAALERVSDRWAATVLYVADRSTDGTLPALRSIAAADPSVRVLALSSRFGHQMSLLAGIDHCDSDALVMMDSDLQHPPALIPRLLEEHERGADIVQTFRRDGDETGLFKRLSSRLFYRVMACLSDSEVPAGAADFRLLSRRVVEVFQRDIRERNLFLRGLIAWVGFRSAGVPFEVGRRAAGGSKYSLGRMAALAMAGVVSFSKRPLQAAIVLGLAFAALGFALAAVTVAQFFVYRSFPPGWTTLAILIPIFSGLQLVFLGVLGEYVGAIFDEVKRRPHYIVEEAVNFPPRSGGKA